MKQTDPMKPVGPWEVTRRILVPALDVMTDVVELSETLMQLPGVRRVAIDPKRGEVQVRYDATACDYQTLFSAIRSQGIEPAGGAWSRFKARWYQFSDTNARDNANAPSAPCCNKPPR